jgi:adenylate cyclase
MNALDTITLFDTLTWLVDAGLDGRSERGLTEGLGLRLNAYGVPVERISMGSEVLDPVLQSRSFIWQRGQEVEKLRHERSLRDSKEWRNTFINWMRENAILKHRTRPGSADAQRFSLLRDLATEGFTDYYARIVPYGKRARIGAGNGLMASFATREPSGFSDDHLMTIDTILPAFALAFMAQSKTRMVTRVLSTYLGDRPAQSVLSGQITRGEPQTIEAVVWMSDIAGYSEAADTMRREGLLEYLNVYAEIVADAVYAHGGEVLKFIGDGVLAVFDSNGSASPAEAALNAAMAVQQAVAAARSQRRAEGKPAAEVIVALHHGEVLFGNFGSSDRLDFTALGPAVNEASRLVSLAKTLEQTVIASSEFRQELDVRKDLLVSLGRYVLRSISGAHHLYAIDPEATTTPVP